MDEVLRLNEGLSQRKGRFRFVLLRRYSGDLATYSISYINLTSDVQHPWNFYRK